jgi:Putative MetA-pathway of phenol degradation
MRITNNFLCLGFSAAALCAAALPAAGASWTQAGATTGSPAGFLPPPGLYFVGAVNYGVGKQDARDLPDGSGLADASGIASQGFLWVPGWSFLGAKYAMSVTAIEIESGFHNSFYKRGFYNPVVSPINLSWDLGHGFGFSVGEGIYLPLTGTDEHNPGAGFEQHFNLSYVANDWVASINGWYTLSVADAGGFSEPDTLNIDYTLAHNFGKWQLGIVGYTSWDTTLTSANRALGKGEDIGIGGLVGYDFGPVNLQLKATHELVSHGDSQYEAEDTRVWVTLVIPVWTPTPAPTKALVAKY